MLDKLSGWDDTIVALSTPPGIGAIGVVRLSGPAAFPIVNGLFPAKDIESQPTHTVHVGLFGPADKPIDEVVVSLFKGPRSYTGEDVIEISCHGSPYIQEQIISACVAAGARLARAGEFTQRAFLHGKLDLTQAEAVADLIASNSQASRRTALNNVRGGFSELLKELRERLVQFSAMIELELDFSQEDVEFADRTQFYTIINDAISRTTGLVESYALGNVIKHGVSVAIIGKPNAGKSTLLNALLNEERAIVSDIAGTTRDTIEEMLNIQGVLFRLIDTAGIRSHTDDTIEAIGMERSLEKMRGADLVLYIFDSAEADPAEVTTFLHSLEQEGIKYIAVGNKMDQASPAQLETLRSLPNSIFISARQLAGIDDLKQLIFDATVHRDLASEDVVVTNSRHHAALLQVQRSLLDIRAALDNHLPGDLLALDIRQCLHYISEITGDITNDTVLDYVFSKFCIGK